MATGSTSSEAQVVNLYSENDLRNGFIALEKTFSAPGYKQTPDKAWFKLSLEERAERRLSHFLEHLESGRR